MATTSLTVEIASLRGTFPTEESGWYKYVCDHRNALRSEGTAVMLSPERSQTYKYRPAELLSTYNFDASVVWIVLMINDIPSNQAFVGITSLIIPSEDTLTRLYTAYSNSKTAQQEAAATLTV